MSDFFEPHSEASLSRGQNVREGCGGLCMSSHTGSTQHKTCLESDRHPALHSLKLTRATATLPILPIRTPETM